MSINKIKKELRVFAKNSKNNPNMFFKTKKGSYGEGDLFIGISVPNTRIIAKNYFNISLNSVNELLKSKFHEERLCAVLILVEKFQKGDNREKKSVVDFYSKNAKKINNWDLVDLSASKILGEYFASNKSSVNLLHKFSKSKNLWERRISIIATHAFIRKGVFKHTLKISECLIRDPHDLIHKAVGWMLREVGKKDKKILENFLDEFSSIMPRTMLRYSIEKFSYNKRKFYMKK